MPHDIARGSNAGFFRYLTKPIRVNELIDTRDVALSVGLAAPTSEPAVAPVG